MFNGLNNVLTQMKSGLSATLTIVTSLVVIIGLLAIAVLSIMSMFVDEQQAQRYKRWRTNVFKAILIVGAAGGLLIFISQILNAANLWKKPGDITNDLFN